MGTCASASDRNENNDDDNYDDNYEDDDNDTASGSPTWAHVLLRLIEMKIMIMTITTTITKKMTMMLFQGHRHGHMCFCEEDECNASEKPTLSIFLASLLLLWICNAFLR